jgi:hypothetical protein
MVAKGYRVVFESGATCYEEPPPTRQYEFHRKIRTAARGIYSLFTMKRLLNPFRYGVISPMLFSHKVLRWLSVYFLFVFFIANLYTFQISLFYRVCLYFQLLFYFLAFLGYLAGNKLKVKVIKVPFSFLMLNVSSLLGMINALRGKIKVTWDTQR